MSALIELKDDCSEKIHYDNADYPIYIRHGILSRYPNYAAPSHWHDDIEFIVILDGEMNYNVNGEIVRLRKDEGIFVNARQMHFGFSDTKTECEFICIILHPLLLCSLLAYEQDFVLPVIRSSISFVFLDPNICWHSGILEQLNFMYRCKEKKTAPLDVQSSFAAIWSLLYENIPLEDNLTASQSSDLSIVRDMVGFIQKNYTQKISLEDIALSGAVGQSKCCKLFAKYFRQSPNNYLNGYRLNKSLELLCCDDISVTEIALSVGFGGASYYAELFRKHFGKSPTEYKKANCSKNK